MAARDECYEAAGVTARGQRHITSADVAEATGLSRTTVSYVLNDTPGHRVPEVTRQRVLDAAKRLGYTPSVAARALRTGRTNVVLTILPDWPISSVLADLIESCSALLAKAGYTSIAYPSTGGTRPVAEVWKSINPAAVISVGELSAEDAQAARSAGVEVLLTTLGEQVEDRSAGGISVGQELIGHLQVKRLIEGGHTQIGYAASADPRLAPFDEPRHYGVREACVEHGLPAPVTVKIALDSNSARDGLAQWRSTGEPVTGICAFNDEVAIALLAAARSQGVQVPTDLAVIGCDNIPLTQASDPPLTTVALDVDVLGAHLVETTISRIEGRPVPRLTTPLYSVVIRDSA